MTQVLCRKWDSNFKAYTTLYYGRKRSIIRINPNNNYNPIFCNTFYYNHCMCSDYLLYTVTASGHIIRWSILVTLLELQK